MTLGYHSITKNVTTVNKPASFNKKYWWIIIRQLAMLKKNMPGVPCLKMMGVETLFSCQVIFISGREITRGNMERRINNKKQYEGKKSFIIMLLPLPFSLSDSSPVPYCAKALTHRASSRWINTVAHGFEQTSEAQRRCLILYLWTNRRQEHGRVGFFGGGGVKKVRLYASLGGKTSHYFLKFVLTTDSVLLHPLSGKLKQHTHSL